MIQNPEFPSAGRHAELPPSSLGRQPQQENRVVLINLKKIKNKKAASLGKKKKKVFTLLVIELLLPAEGCLGQQGDGKKNLRLPEGPGLGDETLNECIL